MLNLPRPPRRRFESIVAPQQRRKRHWLPPLVVAVASCGFLFHTSCDPIILGKYDLRYFLFLILWYLALVPGTWLFFAAMRRTDVIHFRSGRSYVSTPRRKAWLLLFLGLIGYLLVDAAARQELVRHTMTRADNVYHPYLQNVPRPGDAALHINHWGFRGEEIQRQKPSNTCRIFVFGGSTVICDQIPFEQLHTRVLEKQLQAACSGRQIEVQNLGAEWHTSAHSLVKFLLDAQDFSPDVVIVWHGIDDLCRSFEADAFCTGPFRRDYGNYCGASMSIVRPAETWHLLPLDDWFSDFRFQQVRLRGPQDKGVQGLTATYFPKAEPVPVKDWPSLGSFERNLRSFVTAARAKGCRVVLATQPSLYRADLGAAERQCLVIPAAHQFSGKQADLDSMIEGMQRFNDATRRIAAECDATLVDLDREVPKTQEYMYDDVHYTIRGCERIGGLLADAIIRKRLIW